MAEVTVFSEDLHSDSGEESDGRIVALACLYTLMLYPQRIPGTLTTSVLPTPPRTPSRLSSMTSLS